MALPYQQTFYNSEGFANENYRGIFLVFKPPTGGALLLDVFARRLNIHDTSDWLQVRDYLLDVNNLIHFKDREHPGFVSIGKSGLDQLRTVSLPKRNPLCLGSYLVSLPKGTSFDVSAGGYYHLFDNNLGLDAFVSYGEQTKPDIVDSYQVLKPGCQSHLDALQPAAAASSKNADAQIRYTRTMNPPPDEDCPKTRRFFGILAARGLTQDAAITFDVFVRSQPDQRSLPTKRWQQIADYLSSLQRQTLNSCEQPGTGNDPGGTRPIPLRAPPIGRSSSALLVETKSDHRCMI
jgi:hypothetical protein